MNPQVVKKQMSLREMDQGGVVSGCSSGATQENFFISFGDPGSSHYNPPPQGVPRNFTHNWQQLGKSLIHSDKAQVMAGTTNSLSGQPAPHHESLHSLRNRLYRIDCWCFWVLL